jgi:hypothetical protein
MLTYEKGKYQAEIVTQGFEEVQNEKHTPYFYLMLKIVGRYDADDTLRACPQAEREYRQYINTETGVRILGGELRALGVDVAGLTQLRPGEPNHVSLVGRRIDVMCDHESYNGKPRERWRIPRSRRKLDVATIRQLDDQFGHLLRGNNPPPPPPPPAAPNTSDEAF